MMLLDSIYDDTFRMIPNELLLDTGVLYEDLVDDEELVALNNDFNRDAERRAVECISDLQPEKLKHIDIHCISFTSATRSVCGLSLEHFGRLFEVVGEEMKIVFPHSPHTISADATASLYCSRRMKLFLCLYRLKQACSYRHMEVLFGWCKSSQEEWFTKTLHLLYEKLFRYHDVFLKHKGKTWQRRETNKWMLRN